MKFLINKAININEIHPEKSAYILRLIDSSQIKPDEFKIKPYQLKISLELGASPHILDNYGNSVLMKAVCGAVSDSHFKETISALLKKDIDLTIKNIDGENVFDIAKHCGKEEELKQLLNL
ncbi:ankyrin repeat domain-containing protein [Zooshikella ganghwensis]|uniref:Ankyrin repeat domain-containing protein n=3 Tax=Zooshikella ganghwensis TaxID=202772 RepID=A0A4V1IMV6_9GAMM|nr:ankyrin repeat domain-containing protein [Zooshikella ganghwensis]